MLKYKQIGPYVYDVLLTKSRIYFNDNETSVKYVQKVVFKFNDDLSDPLSDSDIIKIINLVYVSRFGC